MSANWWIFLIAHFAIIACIDVNGFFKNYCCLCLNNLFFICVISLFKNIIFPVQFWRGYYFILTFYRDFEHKIGHFYPVFSMQICEILLMDYEIDMMSIKGWRRLSLKARKVIMNRVKSVLAQNFSKSVFLRQKDTISTRASHVVTHRTTSRARTILTSEIGRDRVLYGWYDRSW